MQRLASSIVALLALVSPLHVQPSPPEPAATKLLFQTLTLMPNRVERLDLPSPVAKAHGSIRIVVTVDADSAEPQAGRPIGRRASRRAAGVATIKAFVYTNWGRAVQARATTGEDSVRAVNPDSGGQIVFTAKPILRKYELLSGIGLVSDRRVTLLEVTYFDGFPR